MPPIGVLPMGDVPQIAVKSVAAYILGYLNLETDILSSLEHPEYAYDKKRLQYDAGTILKTLEPISFNAYSKIVCVLDADLFVPILTYVFGEARQGGKHALVSINRLKKNPDGSVPPMDLVLERTAKIALHELGHLFDIHHCTDGKCLMFFLATLKDLDNVSPYFCRYCSISIREALRRQMSKDQ
ncbi:archaemetzincin family Zn-dependent metalloprotease [Thermodesulfobacteriota bacterium]